MRPARRCLQYQVKSQDGGTVTLTAADVIMWHFQWMRAVGERVVFYPRGPRVPPDREHRQQWLRQMLITIIPCDDVVGRKCVDEVTPHAFRPGLAGDLLQEGAPMPEIMRRCRWMSERVARIYAERPSLGARATTAVIHVVEERQPGVYVPTGAMIAVDSPADHVQH